MGFPPQLSGSLPPADLDDRGSSWSYIEVCFGTTIAGSRSRLAEAELSKGTPVQHTRMGRLSELHGFWDSGIHGWQDGPV